MLAGVQARGPENAGEGLVVEEPRQQLGEHGGESDSAVAQRPRERLPGTGSAILDKRNDLKRALRGPAEVGVCRQPGQCGIQVPAVHFEGLFLQPGEADVGVARGDPVQGPAPRWHQPHEPAPDALFSHLDVDLELGSERP